MSSASAVLGQVQQRRGRARVARGQSLRWTQAGVLLLACACGSSEGSSSAPQLTREPPDAGPPAPASPPADSSPGPDAGTAEPPLREFFPSDALPLPPADSAPANDDPAAGNDPPADDDPELACSSGQPQVICLDTARVVICASGQPIETSCNTLCGTYGRLPGPCDDGCQCGEPSNPTCVQASADFCACTALLGDGCTPETQERLYLACHVNGIGGELMACTADFRATRPDAPIDAAFCTDLDDACN
jgi:hypothetical protein